MDLAEQVVETAGQPCTVRIGVVLAINPTVRVDIQGAVILPESVGVLGSYVAAVGDTVAVLGQAVEGDDTSASTWLILGPTTASSAGALSHAGRQIMAAAQVENAGVFINMTGLTFPFVKRRDGSLIHARMAGASFASVAANGGEFSARILDAAGAQVAEQVIASMFYNAALTHGSWSGFDDIPNIPAGAYTIQARFRRYVGAAAIQTDNNDRLSLYFDEV